MNSDAFYIQGASHNYCQDYCISNDTKDWSLIVACDGVSTTEYNGKVIHNQYSDIAARMLAILSLKIMNGYYDKPDTLEDLIKKYHKELGINISDSTYGYIAISDILAVIFTIGDFRICIEREDGFEVRSTDFSPNYPANYSYFIDEHSRQKWLDSGIIKTNKFSFFNKSLELQNSDRSEKTASVEDFMCFKIVEDSKRVKTITLMTDGISSINFEKTGMTEHQFIAHCCSYKSKNGEFVKRRLNSLRRQFNANQNPFQDDVSMAAINLED